MPAVWSNTLRGRSSNDNDPDAAFTIYRQSDGEYLAFDGANDEGDDQPITSTDHPIAQYARVTDHVQRGPRVRRVTAWITESPFAPSDNTGMIAGPERVFRAMRFLDGCVGQRLSLGTTRDGILDDYILIGYPSTVTQARERVFSLAFRRIVLARAVSVALPARRLPPVSASKLGSKAELGPKTPKVVDLDVSTAESFAQLFGYQPTQTTTGG